MVQLSFTRMQIGFDVRGADAETQRNRNVCSEAICTHLLLACWVDQSQLSLRGHVSVLTEGGRGGGTAIQVIREREYFIRHWEYSIRGRKYFVREGIFRHVGSKRIPDVQLCISTDQDSCTACSISNGEN